MRARILVLDVDDNEKTGIGAVEIVTPGYDGWDSTGWDQHVLREARAYYGATIAAHGFIDVEIPDDVIATVLLRPADAGAVAAGSVSEVGS